MILVLVRLCYALYATESASDPIELRCLDFDTPVQYDVTECKGEVTTPAVDVWDVATCETTEEDDDGSDGLYEADDYSEADCR